MAELLMYQQIDPHDIRVGHRYHRTSPELEHDYTVFRVSLIGDRIRVETFNGHVTTLPVDGPCFITCDLPGC